MKFTFLALTMAAITTHAANLRTTTTTKYVSSSSLLESEVILHGVMGEPSPYDLDIIGQALVTSYNDAHWELGHYMTGFDVPFQSGIPEALKQSCGGTCSDDDNAKTKNGLFLSVVTPIKQSCGGTCSDDDRSSSSSILTKAIKQSCGGTCSDDDSATEKQVLIESFCRKIKSSGSTYLETVKDCSVVFAPLQAKHSKHSSKQVDSRTSATMEAHVILQGVLEEASETDMTIIGKALVASYNDVNWDTPYYMSDVALPFQATMPQPLGQSCGGTCSDDDRAKTGNKGLFVTLAAPIKQSCGGTCSDDDAAVAVLKQSCGGTCSDDDSASRNMLEASFCEKIKSSVSTNLANANMCAIVLVAKK